MNQNSVAWTSVQIVALLHRHVGLSSGQSFELAEAMNLTPNELDRKMNDAADLLEEVVGRASGQVSAPSKPRKPRKKETSRSVDRVFNKEGVELPFLPSPFATDRVLEAREYNPKLVDRGNRAYYTALPRLQALSRKPGELESAKDCPSTRSAYILKVMCYGLYDSRMARVFASRKTILLRTVNDPKATYFCNIQLPAHSPGAFPPKTPTPCSLWFALPLSVRAQILTPPRGRVNAYREYLLLYMAYGYNQRTSRNLAGLKNEEVELLYQHLGMR